MKTMRYLVTLLFAALSLNAVGQVNPNYNPDYDADGFINVNDLFGFLAAYGNTWDSEEVISGCTYSYAVEYNPLANDDDGSCIFLPDCAGVINGCSLIDECGTCDSDPSNDCVQDCNGNWGGIAALDECGVCGGDNSTCFTSCGDDINHEGYDYSTVQIGDQCWFSENCRYLPSVSDPSIDSTTEPHYSVYGYTGTDVTAAQATDNYESYGVLYNWPAVMTAGICPSGWHIPTDEEFIELTDFLGGESAAGYAMKSTSGWNSGGNGSNSSGWTGLPGGYRSSGGFFSNGYGGHWWTASESGSNSWLRVLDYTYANVYRYNYTRNYGFSARCVRD